MVSNFETGHIRNVANFEILISNCRSYGAKYRPTKQTLTIPSLRAILEQGKNDLAIVDRKKNAYIIADNDRLIVFSKLKQLASRALDALKATDASDQIIEEAESINIKIQGKKTKTITGTDEDIQNQAISVSQQIFDRTLENFSLLVDLVSQEEFYKPNEDELTAKSLKNYLTLLRIKNTYVIKQQIEYYTAMIIRNRTIYEEKTGMIDIASEVKRHVRSVFGMLSPEYKAISKVAFEKKDVF